MSLAATLARLGAQAAALCWRASHVSSVPGSWDGPVLRVPILHLHFPPGNQVLPRDWLAVSTGHGVCQPGPAPASLAQGAGAAKPF